MRYANRVNSFAITAAAVAALALGSVGQAVFAQAESPAGDQGKKFAPVRPDASVLAISAEAGGLDRDANEALASELASQFSAASETRAPALRPARPGGGVADSNEYQWDDGVSENSLGLTGGGPMAWIHHFNRLVGAESLVAVSTSFGTPAFPGSSGALAGDPFTVYVWSDPDGDGTPGDAVLLAQADCVVDAASIETDVLQKCAIGPVALPASFFIGASFNHAPGTFPGPMDQTAPAGEAWVDFNDPLVYDPNLVGAALDMASIGFPTNWLLRANALPAGGPFCGDGVLDTGEECDPPDDTACPGQCQADCTCPPIIIGSCCFQDIGGGTPKDYILGGLADPIDNTLPPTVSMINVPDTGIISDLDVDLQVQHTWVGDLTITLTSPAGTVVTLQDGNCGSADDIDCVYDDASGNPLCNATPPPAVSGTVPPVGALSAFNGEDKFGDWILTIVDGVGGDNGTLLGWSLHMLNDAGAPQKICIDGIPKGECELLNKGIFHPNGDCTKVWMPPDSPQGPSAFICNAGCTFDNGWPLDDFGAPASQIDPAFPFVASAVDDFILNDQGTNPCVMDHLTFWTTHFNFPGPPFVPGPANYAAVWVAVYEDLGGNQFPDKGPAGIPIIDDNGNLNHVGSVVYSQRFVPNPGGALPPAPGTFGWLDKGPMVVIGDLWQVEVDMSNIPLVLKKQTKYWLEIIPEQDFAAAGQTALALSTQNYQHPAQQIFELVGLPDWTEITGNAGGGNVPPGTKLGIAWVLDGFKAPPVPPNDECIDKITITDGDVHFDTAGATLNPADEDPSCGIIGPDIWYNYTAKCTGDLTLTTCNQADFDTVIAAYNANAPCPALLADELGCNDDGAGCAGFTSELTIPVTLGDAIRIRINGWNSSAVGNGTLSVKCAVTGTEACCFDCPSTCVDLSATDCAAQGGTPQGPGTDCATTGCPPPPVVNDCCVDRIPIFDGLTPYDTTGANTDGLAHASCQFDGQTYQDIWYNYVATCEDNGASAQYDTDLVVYDCGGPDCTAIPCPPPDADLLGCNDDNCSVGFHSFLQVAVVAGNAYKIRVGGWNPGDEGPGELLIECSNVGVCGDPNSGDCCVANGTPNCDDAVCCDAICAIDPCCCDIVWDSVCAAEAAASASCACDPCAGVDCSFLDDDCNVGVCDPADGSCSAVPANEGGPCDDGAACTDPDTCQSGVCVGGPPVVCPPIDACNGGACDPGGANGNCDLVVPEPAGTVCKGTDPCGEPDACDGAGVCVDGAPVVCPPIDQCNNSACDPAGPNGNCNATVSKPDGTPCDDGDPCTDPDTCTAGVCDGICNPQLYADIWPRSKGGDTLVEVNDVLCVVAANNGNPDDGPSSPNTTPLGDCGTLADNDIFPCPPAQDGLNEVGDLLNVLAAAGGFPPCPDICVCP